ncbi:MAG: hypothetical protein ABFC57_02895 [Veillonellales bacterium]
MKIGNMPVGMPGPNGNVQAEPQLEVEQTGQKVTDAAKLVLNNLVKTLMSEAAGLLQQRDTILLSLPAEIQPTVENIIQKNMPGLEDLSRGAASLAALQKKTTDQLQQLLTLLTDSAGMTDQLKPQLTDSLQQAIRTYTPLKEMSTELLTADDLISMAKQLLANPSSDIGIVVADRSRQLWQQSPLAAAVALPEASQKALSQFIALLSQHVPEPLKTAAAQYNLPELPELWALLQAKDVLKWWDMTPDKLSASLQSLRKLVMLLQKPETVQGETIANTTILSMNTPLYLGDGTQPYPAYIHIFHESPSPSGSSEGRQYETWIHICLQTEYAGTVDVVFRLYQQDQLDVRVSFSVPQAARLFNECLSDIKAGFRDFALHLSQISVKAEADEP